MTQIQIQIPEKVNKIIRTLAAAGHEAYAVGGCVRDAVLGREPADWDITTSALPMEVKALFGRTIDTGLQHGTVTVMLEQEGFEVTTYRVDGEYEDCRHPKEVRFTRSLPEDLKRRDFTINAMAYNEAEGLVDAFDGIGDLRRGIIRCVGRAEERFTEDALRMLRAVRFSAQLGFVLEEGTRSAIESLCGNLKKVSAERIQAELVKLLTSPHPERLREAWETGITRVVLPEFDACMACGQNNPHHIYSVGEHTLHALQRIEADKTLRLAVLLHDFGKPEVKTTDEAGVDHFKRHQEAGGKLAEKILRRLKFDNETIRTVTKLEALQEVGRIYEKILKEKDCITLKQLAVSGRDLMEAGFSPGPKLGEILQELLERVLEDPEKNQKEWLLQEAVRKYGESGECGWKTADPESVSDVQGDENGFL